MRTRARRRHRPPSPGRLRSVHGHGELLQPPVDRHQHVLGEALLGAEDLGGAEEPDQRVVDVAGGHQPDVGDPGPGRRQVDLVDPVQPGRPDVEPRVRRGPERREQAGAAVVGAAAAQPDHHGRRPGVERGRHQLPHAERGAPGRRPRRPVRWMPQACALSTYAVSPTSRTVAGTGPPKGPGDRDREHLATEGGVQHVDEARPAVGHRRQVQLVVRRLATPARRDGVGRLDRGERAGELVGGDEDAHAGHPVPRRAAPPRGRRRGTW